MRGPHGHLRPENRSEYRTTEQETDVTDQATDGVTDQGSESENPAIDTPTPKAGRPRTNQDW